MHPFFIFPSIAYGLITSTAILGLIIVVMEESEFPGWGVMSICVIAAVVPSVVINSFLPDYLFPIGLFAGAMCSGLAITTTCGMGFQRSMLAASIYLGLQVSITYVYQIVS